ncbi:diguanylate cyclase (GGDEF) domain-containing protein [Idiomarina sp. A28L]|uniref:bifunctional diguanylate cyclase/phosphodiesterase n=1 Tax=Idiomarina sp. A28L TaxID=1036674 RepID=UPI000213873B|nr:EAL domain-containing protein [Idiomarina sp. A28L]EGN76404.1 diguanylate cyclase (GGDEF) domain-containing protein [Idiomarina sp. A28L]
MGINFRTRLLLMVGGCISAALLVVVVAIIISTQQSVDVHTERELEVSQRVVTQLIDYRDSQLRQAALVLADDFGFRQALATADDDTIISALTNQAQRIDSDLVMLLEPSTEVMVTSHEISAVEMTALRSFMNLDANQDNSAGAAMLVAEQELFQVVLVPIRAPHLLAWLVLGFAVDRDLAEQLQQLTNSSVHFVTGRYTGNPSVISSAAESVQTELTNAVRLNTTDVWLQEENEQGVWLSLSTHSETNEEPERGGVYVFLTSSRKAAEEPFAPLQQQLIIIVVLTLFITVLVTLFASRRFVEPLRKLALAAGDIAKGNYKQKIVVRGKDEISTLAKALDKMQSAIADRESEISYQSNHDLLTGLANQRAFNRDAELRLVDEAPWTLIILNFDNFRSLNEMFGQSVCDDLLKRFSERLSALAEPKFKVARRHGDEFVLTYNGTSDFAALELKTILVKAAKVIEMGGVRYTLSLSAGLAEAPLHTDDRDELVRLAQFARNKAKREKLEYSIYQKGEDEPYLRTLLVSAAIPDAIKNEEFTLVYQPQLRKGDHTLLSTEALIRWQDPELGFVSPAEFIPLAEQSGHIFAITKWVLKQSLQQLGKWQKNLPELGISVNLSGADLAEPKLLDVIFGALANAGVAASSLTVEVTESAVVKDPEQAIEQLTKLRAAGIHVAIDDYGTGYSSLAQLRGMPATELKIDRSFIMDLALEEADRTIVQSTIDMAHKLGLKVVAEGVEDEQTANLLADYNCDVLQGYWFSKPLTAEDFELWLAKKNNN